MKGYTIFYNHSWYRYVDITYFFIIYEALVLTYSILVCLCTCFLPILKILIASDHYWASSQVKSDSEMWYRIRQKFNRTLVWRVLANRGSLPNFILPISYFYIVHYWLYSKFANFSLPTCFERQFA